MGYVADSGRGAFCDTIDVVGLAAVQNMHRTLGVGTCTLAKGAAHDFKTKESGPGTFIFKFSVKLRLEWWYFRRMKPKPCPNGDKTVFQGPYVGGETTPEFGRAGGDLFFKFFCFVFSILRSPFSIQKN